MKFIVRYLGLVISEKELTPGTYTIGRAEYCDIRLTQDFISREHGKLYFDDGRWFYQDLRKGHPHFKEQPREIVETQMVELENDIDLMMEAYLYRQTTEVYDIKDLKSMAEHSSGNRRRIAFVATLVVVLAALAGGGYLVYHLRKPMDANELLAFVRPRVVEFELVVDVKQRDQIKKAAELKDEDFKDTQGFCSGFIIAPNVVLTAMHCIRGNAGFAQVNRHFSIKTHDGRTHKPKRVLGFSFKRDFLFLEVPGLDGYGKLEFADDCHVGQKVYTIGNVAGEGIAIRDGLMANTTKDPNNPKIEYVRFSAAASPGNSGGPLVDGYGNVVGLVFARTFSENYNLATGAKYLLQGNSEFVTNTEKKSLNISTEEMLGNAGLNLVFTLGLPMMSSWSEHPKYMRLLENIEFDVNVPASLDAYAKQVAEKFNEAVTKSYNAIVNIMLVADHADGRWSLLRDKRAPILVPWQLGQDLTSTEELKEKVLSIPTVSVLQPPSRRDFKLFLDTLKKEKLYRLACSSSACQAVEKDSDEDTTNAEAAGKKQLVRDYQFWSYGKLRLHSLMMQPQPYARLVFDVTDTDWNAARKIDAEFVTKGVTGKEGALFATNMFPLVRPKAHREFTINSLPGEPESAQIKDAIGRNWKRFSWDLFGNLMLDAYCLPLPQGGACLNILMPAPNSPFLEQRRKNFVQYQLSELVFDAIRWDTRALVDYFEKGLAENLIPLRDVTVSRDDGGALSIGLKTMGIQFSLPKNEQPTNLRILAGYRTPTENKPGGWVALGFEGYFSEGKKRRVCGMAVDMKQARYLELKRTTREEVEKLKTIVKNGTKAKRAKLKREEHADSVDKLLYTADIQLENRTTPAELVGYCRKMDRLNEKELKYYGIGTKPYHVKWTVEGAR